MKKISDLKFRSKLLLSIGIITTFSTITIGSLIGYANNSDEVNGIKYPNNDLSNNFASIFKNNEIQAEVYILDPLKKEKVAFVNEDATQFWFAKDKETKYNFDDFFKKYFEIYNDEFVLEVKYSSFSFFNEYVLAVRPKEFIKFTKWFMKEVAWGPDLVTLDSFSIVKGVKVNGNAITLGSHTTLRKEENKIEFYPDAFFGSLPIYSQLSGDNNWNERLTTDVFSEAQTKEKIDDLISSIPLISTIANSSNYKFSFLGIAIPKKLKNQELYLVKNKNNNDYLFLDFDKKPTVDEFNKYLKNKNQNEKQYDFNDIKKYIISSTEAKSEELEYDEKDNTKKINASFLALTLEEIDEIKNIKINNNKIRISLDENYLSSTSLVNYEVLKKYHDKQIEHFLDFYDVKEHKGKTLFSYVSPSSSKQWFFKSKLKAINTLKELKDYSKITEEQKKHFKFLKINDIFVQDSILTIKLIDNENEKNEQILKFDSKNMSDDDQELFEQFKLSIGYNGSLNPITLSYGPEEKNIFNKYGEEQKGLNSRYYNIYVERYSNLLEKITKKYPHILRKSNGPHIVKKINDKGFYEYTIQDGEHHSFKPDDRIGLALILGALDEKFDGFSYDFLKYVSAHEYGHHFTLDQIKNLNSVKNSIILGAIDPRTGLSDDSFYSKYALNNYLKARSTLDFTTSHALGHETSDSSYIKFKFLTKNGEWKTETKDEVWGSSKKNATAIDISKNKSRRFLQTWKGIEEAAKIRGVKISDLFLANSLDENSGTLNPTIGGENKIIYTSKENNENKKQWEVVDAKKIISELKDGVGNPILNAVKFKGNNVNNFDLEIVQIVDNKAVKINLFDRDGNPLINVPLNEDLDDATKEYIKSETKKISNIIKSIVVLEWNESGWDRLDTKIGGKIEFTSKYLLPPPNNWLIPREENWKYDLFDYEIKTRTRNNNVVPKDAYGFNNAILESRTSSNYYSAFNLNKESYAFNDDQNKNDKISKQNSLFNNAYVFSSSSEKATEGIVGAWWQYFLSVNDSGKVFAFVEKNKNNNYEIKEKFTFPLNDSSKFLKNLHDSSSDPTPWPKILQQILKNENLAKFQKNIHTEIIKSLESENGIFKFVNQNNQIIDFGEFLLNKKTLSKDELKNKYATSFEKIILYNYENIFNIQNNFYNSFVKKYHLKVDGEAYISLAFDSLNELLNFSSIDYSKAKIENIEFKNNKEEYIINWDINYVKTKFDLEEFKKGVLNSEYESQELKNIVSNNNEQMIANELMNRFRFSNLFLSVKDFNPTKSLVENQVIFTKEYGIDIFDSLFKNMLIFDESNIQKHNLDNYYSIKNIQEKLKEFIISMISNNRDQDEILELIDTQDLYKFIGNIFVSTFRNDVAIYQFYKGTPSQDFVQYAETKIENQVKDKFSDYVYNIAETLTRDFVQITYKASANEFDKLSTFITGINEEGTSLDYVVDAVSLKSINDKFIDLEKFDNYIVNGMKAQKADEYIKKISPEILQNSYLIDKNLEITDSLKKNLKRVDLSASEKEKINSELEEIINNIKKIYKKNNLIIKNNVDELYPVFLDEKWAQIHNGSQNRNKYFGKFITKSNGFVKDMLIKEKVDMHFYDKDLNEIHDDTIRLKDWDGNKITSRPKAFFVSQILNFGAGNRNISGIFRKKSNDAVALYGFMKNEDAKKIKYIKFYDEFTKKPIYIKFNTEKTNNLFYLKKQSDLKSKVTLEDLGYTTWISDYVIMGKYRDGHLKPKHKYTIEFVDENYNLVTKAILGDLEAVTENGKTSDQAPIQIFKDKNNNNATTIQINHQFRVSN
ncbi:PDxFFG protein [Mesomycoplasma neurolyticum]|uniref:PDxFFG protein n=1 Tax=Mesomycoplasma neurolyticum TaxID=2120 RepID=A0A449A4P3_9BACT|nr:PDxFFG protein [Mesomycoplasma neurolyticum]VEU59207.1 Uncharacterised protein [Mesomycoplasma neurolyticum]